MLQYIRLCIYEFCILILLLGLQIYVYSFTQNFISHDKGTYFYLNAITHFYFTCYESHFRKQGQSFVQKTNNVWLL